MFYQYKGLLLKIMVVKAGIIRGINELKVRNRKNIKGVHNQMCE